VKITYEIEIKPFTVPNFVIPVQPEGKRQDGFKPVEGIPLKHVPFVTLQSLCEEFVSSVMNKAGYPTKAKE
jgi:hypothetical protein